MTRRLFASSALAACLCAPAALVAQSPFDSIQTPHGKCPLWALGSSGFPDDASYSRCALDRGPSLLAGQPMPPPPRMGQYVGEHFLVTVSADGTVDPKLTRAFSRSSDTTFHRRALETILQWRFEPGIRQGARVRSGFFLKLSSGMRNDTLPATMKWTYRAGLNEDALVGTWVAEAPLPPFAPKQIDSVYAALLRRLIRMQVIVPVLGQEQPYCLVLQNGDSTAHARLSRLAQDIVHPEGREARRLPHGRVVYRLASYGCERTPSALRIVLPRVYRTENNRAVLRPSGDYLRSYPPGFDGRAWRVWQSRCVADVSAQGSVWIDCSVYPQASSAELAENLSQRNRSARPNPVERSDGDSMRVSVIVMTRGAFQMDTLRAIVRALPRLNALAVSDPYPACGGYAAFSLQDSSELYIVKGNPAGTGLAIVRVQRGSAPVRGRGAPSCGPPEATTSGVVAFLLGGIGDRATAPITVCFSACQTSHVLDPARHTVAERAHLTFRISDLRADTRVGDQLTFRIHADPAPPNLLPLVVLRSGNGWGSTAWIAHPVAANVWDYGVLLGGGYSPDTEVHIYLIVR